MSQRRHSFHVEGLEDRRLLSSLPHLHFHHILIHKVHQHTHGRDHGRRHSLLIPATPIISPLPTEPVTSVPPVVSAPPVISPPPAPAVTVIYPPPTGTSSQTSRS